MPSPSQLARLDQRQELGGRRDRRLWEIAEQSEDLHAASKVAGRELLR